MVSRSRFCDVTVVDDVSVGAYIANQQEGEPQMFKELEAAIRLEILFMDRPRALAHISREDWICSDDYRRCIEADV